MESRALGSSGTKLSVMGFGCWQMGSAGTDDYWGLEFTDELAGALVKQAVEAGVTYFDTAEDSAKNATTARKEMTKVTVKKKIVNGRSSDWTFCQFEELDLAERFGFLFLFCFCLDLLLSFIANCLLTVFLGVSSHRCSGGADEGVGQTQRRSSRRDEQCAQAHDGEPCDQLPLPGGYAIGLVALPRDSTSAPGRICDLAGRDMRPSPCRFAGMKLAGRRS